MDLATTVNGRPITIVGIITALHSIVYGIGFIFGIGGFMRTVLYNDITGVTNPTFFGILLLLSGSIVALGLALSHPKMIAISSSIQSLSWFFTFLVYVLNGQFLLGVGIALVWVLLSSYVAYVHAHYDFVVAQVLLNYRKNS
jgi:hypothetical protein